MPKNTRSNDDVLRAEAIALRAEAIALRAASHTNLQIRATLDITGWKLTQLLQGYVAPAHTNLANRAKTELREQARELRRQGWGYPAIARKLRVSKSSLSLWLRDLPKPETFHPGEPPDGSTLSQEEWTEHCIHRMERHRQRRAEERRQEVAAAASEIGELTERELLIAGVVAYWCEGAKTKPWRRQRSLVFINSDPELIQMYLRFLAQLGCGGGATVFQGQHPRERRCDCGH